MSKKSNITPEQRNSIFTVEEVISEKETDESKVPQLDSDPCSHSQHRCGNGCSCYSEGCCQRRTDDNDGKDSKNPDEAEDKPEKPRFTI